MVSSSTPVGYFVVSIVTDNDASPNFERDEALAAHLSPEEEGEFAVGDVGTAHNLGEQRALTPPRRCCQQVLERTSHFAKGKEGGRHKKSHFYEVVSQVSQMEAS